jgi:hypothetical protein
MRMTPAITALPTGSCQICCQLIEYRRSRIARPERHRRDSASPRVPRSAPAPTSRRSPAQADTRSSSHTNRVFATCPAAPSRGAQVVGSEGCRLTAARPAGERLMTAPGGIEPDGRGHSMISSARASTDGGIVRPRAFAVLRLTTRSNLVGCSTGSPAGVAPLTILSISCAAR